MHLLSHRLTYPASPVHQLTAQGKRAEGKSEQKSSCGCPPGAEATNRLEVHHSHARHLFGSATAMLTVPHPVHNPKTTSNPPFCFWRKNSFFKISRNLFDLREPEPQKALAVHEHHIVYKFQDRSFSGGTSSLLQLN